MRKLLCLTMLLIVASSVPAMAGVVGTQCWINGQLVGGFPAGYTCPGTGGGSAGGGSSHGVSPELYSGFYQLGYQFGQWMFGSGSNPQAELQKKQMMAELQRRQAEAERQHQEEEARRLAVMYNRLVATLKLSGLPNLQLKEISGKSSEPKLKLGDSSDGQAGIKGLPGMYLNDEKKPYGIPGLPGIYTGGPGQGSGLTGSELPLKIGQGNAEAAVPAEPNESQQPPAAASNGSNRPALANESGLQLKTGDSNAQPAAQATVFDPSRMTPQQLADVAEMVSKLPPEEQQRMLAAGQPVTGSTGQPSSQALAPARQQAEASQAAAGAPILEDASAKARAGFDQPIGPATPVQLGKSGTMPSTPRPTVNHAPAAVPAATELSGPAPGEDWIKLYLFPGETSRSSRAFPRNPNPPLTNPLREKEKLQAKLKAWDDWAVERAIHVSDPPENELYPLSTERKTLNTGTVKRYAPQLFDRYNSDHAFQQNVDSRLQQVNEKVAFGYYQALANAHKAALLAFQAELEKLAAAGKLDARVALEDQYRLHPERRQLVQSVWDRISVREQAALEQVLTNVGGKLDKEFQLVFQLIRGEIQLQRQ